MLFLNYSNTAPPVALTAGVGNGVGDTSLTVGSTAGYPTAPFLLALERGTASEEIVLCTAVPDATHFTVSRGYDNTTRKTHAIGATVEHTVSALVYRGSGIVLLTTAQRTGLSGDNLWVGRTVFDTTLGATMMWNGTNWVPYHEDIAFFAAEGTLSVKTGKGRLGPWPFPITILGVSAAVNTAPTGAAVVIDINKSGTTIFTTQGNRPQIAASAFATAAEVTTMDVTAVAAGQYLTVDIDQIGSTIAGADLTVLLRYRRG